METEPLVSVLRGTPAAEELAALVAVLASRSNGTDSRLRPAPASTWARSARPSAPPTSWRASALPR